jgi:metallo-beta-lactamase class B
VKTQLQRIMLITGLVAWTTAYAQDDMFAKLEDPAIQKVEAFQIFDNVYYVGMEWVAAYVIDTGDGLILIDALYGDWVDHLMEGVDKLGFEPQQIKYIIPTHGHFDHAGGADAIQKLSGAKVLMTAEDLQLGRDSVDDPRLGYTIPDVDIVEDGDRVELGNNIITMYKTPGHTTGVLSLTYTVYDGDSQHKAITLGGVGLNFAGVERTETYIESYQRLQGLQDGIEVSLPNHAAMAQVFERRDQLASRATQEPHPFVDADSYKASLVQFLAAARDKLEKEKAGTAESPEEMLRRALSN